MRGVGRGVVIGVRGVRGAQVFARFPALTAEDAVAEVLRRLGPGGVVGVVRELVAPRDLSVDHLTILHLQFTELPFRRSKTHGWEESGMQCGRAMDFCRLISKFQTSSGFKI